MDFDAVGQQPQQLAAHREVGLLQSGRHLSGEVLELADYQTEFIFGLDRLPVSIQRFLLSRQLLFGGLGAALEFALVYPAVLVGIEQTRQPTLAVPDGFL